MSDKIRIRLYGVHLGYISSNILKPFQYKCGVVNLNSWIRENIFRDFGIYVDSVEELEEFIGILELNYYENICDWIREKIRYEMKKIANEENE